MSEPKGTTMKNGIKQAIERFNNLRKEQAQGQSDRDPFLEWPRKDTTLPYPYGTNGTVAPLQGRLNTRSEVDCCCKAVCSDCIEYQMTLNQAH